MIKPISLKQVFKKDIKTICLIIGGFYTLFGAFALIILKLQSVVLSNFESSPDDSFNNLFNLLHGIWKIYMPLLILLGIGYLLFGLFYNRYKGNKYQINLMLSILCVVWVITYSVSCLKYLDVFFATAADDFEAFKYIGYVFAGFGFIAVLAIFTVPQYIIGKKIKDQEIEFE